MNSEKRDLLGFSVTITGIASTLQEAIAAAGSEQAVLDDYNANVLAHSHYTLARKAMVKKLEELSGVKRKTTKEGDKEVISEKDAEYVARLETELGEEVVNGFSAQIDALVAAIPVDYKPGTRGSGETAKPAKKWLAYYDLLETEGKLDGFIAKHGLTFSNDEEKKVIVANKVKQIVTEKEKAAAASALE